MTDAKPPLEPQAPPARPTSGNTNTSAALPPSDAARQRLSHRRSSRQDFSPSPGPSRLLRRRSSLLSFSSLDDAASSFAEDIINPRTGSKTRQRDEDELTHWHSSPLAFAILPAVGGLMFKNGSAFVTDVLLLGLAAIFMNWSITLPWDWYYSAQALRRDVEPDVPQDVDEVEEDEIAVQAASPSGSPQPSTERRADTPLETDEPVQNISKREQATEDLRQQEFMALVATFLFPILAAYLLHVIRAQLSRPSTGLVSDYNLCIFLLAAEIRPVRQVVKLMAKRTLYLQRTVTGIDDPFASALKDKNTVDDISSRLAELEARLADKTAIPSTISMAQKPDVNELSSEMKKRYEPRLEGLERAVRRYEKRSTTMAINVEQRLLSLDTRLQEAISLAAVAAKHSENRGILAKFFDTLSALVVLPMKMAMQIIILPFNALDSLYKRMKTVILGPMPPRPSKRKSSRIHDGSGRDDRPRDKGLSRKVVR